MLRMTIGRPEFKTFTATLNKMKYIYIHLTKHVKDMCAENDKMLRKKLRKS